MSSVPAAQRSAASGMRATFQNTGTALSIGVFFSLMIAGLAGTLPKTLTSGLQDHGVPRFCAGVALSHRRRRMSCRCCPRPDRSAARQRYRASKRSAYFS
jgi:hypothetical protein